MARESFLINPAKGHRKVKRRVRKVKRNAWPGESVRHAKAAKVGWAERKTGRTISRTAHRLKNAKFARPKGAHYPSWAGKKVSWSPGKPKKNRRKRKNPFGSEVLLVGNPRRKRRRSRRKVASKAIFSMNRKRRVHHRRRKSYAMNPVRHRRRSNRRRYHRNPMSSSGMKSMIMPIAVGVGAYYATQSLPTMLGMTSGITRTAVQAGIGIGGAMLLKKMIGKENAMIFGVVSGALVVISLLNQYVFTATSVTPTIPVSGFGAFNPGQRIPNMSRKPLIPLSRPIMSAGAGFNDSPVSDPRYQY